MWNVNLDSGPTSSKEPSEQTTEDARVMNTLINKRKNKFSSACVGLWGFCLIQIKID